MGKVSTIDESIIHSGRMVGNTSRQINLAIDMLFKRNTVIVRDHYEHGKNKEANKRLMSLIIKRLQTEYSNTLFNIDKNTLEIKLIWE